MAQVVVTTQKKSQPTAHGLGITIDKPKYPHYAGIVERKKTYEELNWPPDSAVEVNDLVEAGLVYTGVADSVRCYYCGGGLRNWEVGDDPFKEHAHWYPTCPHIKFVKGCKYIQTITDGGDPADTSDSASTLATAAEEVAMNSAAALAVIEMGYSTQQVSQAIKLYQHRHGKTGLTGSELFKLVLELEENPAIYDQLLQQSPANMALEESTPESLEELESENQRLREGKFCPVCKQLLADIVLLPCGHRVCCQCGPGFIGRTCYREDCNQEVNGLIKVYYAIQTELRADNV